MHATILIKFICILRFRGFSVLVRCWVVRHGHVNHVVPKFGEHSRAIKKALNHHHLNQPAAVSDHFIVQGHSFKDIKLIPLKLDNSHQQ